MAIARLKPNTYSDAVYVEGVFGRNPMMERALYNYCKRYFDVHYKGVFFVGTEHKDDIFQESFLQFWDIIMKRRIYVKDGELLGKGERLLTGKLTTYFMGIAKLKYLEWVRKNKESLSLDDPDFVVKEEGSMEDFVGLLYDKEDKKGLEIIADCISKMSKRCNQILTMFYCEEKTLDVILEEIPSFESKNALKTTKYKCMETLRKFSNEIYKRFIQS